MCCLRFFSILAAAIERASELGSGSPGSQAGEKAKHAVIVYAADALMVIHTRCDRLQGCRRQKERSHKERKGLK